MQKCDEGILRDIQVTFEGGNQFLVLVFSQEEFSPEDPANPCVNYPTEEYSSYADCDDHFVREPSEIISTHCLSPISPLIFSVIQLVLLILLKYY